MLWSLGGGCLVPNAHLITGSGYTQRGGDATLPLTTAENELEARYRELRDTVADEGGGYDILASVSPTTSFSRTVSAMIGIESTLLRMSVMIFAVAEKSGRTASDAFISWMVTS